MGTVSLDDIKVIGRYDRSNMIGTIESFPFQCREAVRIGGSFSLPSGLADGINNVVCTGLGGSAIGADLARSYAADDARIPVIVNRNYALPGFVDGHSLVIVSSYSGNTEETLAAYKDARKRNARIAVISSGGELARRAKSDAVPMVSIPGGLQPRCAVGYSFFTTLILLSKAGIIKDQAEDIEDAIAILEDLREKELGSHVPEKKNIAKMTARSLAGLFPVIYGGQDHIDSVVTRWRGQIAENSKTLSSAHLFPEMNHNEIVGWAHPDNILKHSAVVLLRDAGDSPRVSKRIDITRGILSDEGVKVKEVWSRGGGLLARMLSLVYIGDFVSFYLAILNEEDPTPVERITRLKKELAKS
ncbi:MAG: bifunctional phosphoglucose/phosphomannose isomerase [Candidatus Omnitrophota bacterium]